MKWIVKTDFYRTPELADVDIVDVAKLVDAEGKPHLIDGKPITLTKEAPHLNHFHAGSIIELGKSANESELQTGSKDSKTVKALIATLRYAGRIGDASDKAVVDRVIDDVATAKKREANQAKIATNTDNSGLVAAFTALLSKAAATPAKA